MTRRRAEVLLVAIPAVLGTAAVLAVARRGAYASPDSAFYVGVARALREGGELVAPPGSHPLGHFPPLFPMVLAGAAALAGADPLAAVEAVNPVLFGATALLVGLVVRHRTGSAAWGAGASIVAVVARDLLVYGASALSEPLFTLLALGGLVALAAAISRRSNRLLSAAAVLVGLACATRYAGAALIVAGVVALAWFERWPGRWRAAAFAAGASAPLAAWMVAVGRTNRHLALHLPDTGYWTMGLEALSRWVAPPTVPDVPRLALLAAVALAAVAVAAVATARGARAPEGPADRAGDALPFVLAAFAAAYLALLVVDRAVIDASGRLDGRFLAPLHAVALVGLAPPLRRVLLRTPRSGAARAVRAGGVAALAGLLALQAHDAARWTSAGLTDDRIVRRGLSARVWRESPVLRDVAALPAGVPVYTNAPDAVALLTRRRTSSLPSHRDLLTGRPARHYPADVDAMARRLRRLDGVVVYFWPYRFRELFLPSPADVAREVPLERLASDGIAALYRPAG